MNKTEKKNYEEGKQCISCRHYSPLPHKKLSADFGYCCNEDSKHWYHVIFEHHTCEQFEHDRRVK